MNYIVGDHAVINKGSYRTGRKNMLVKILELEECENVNGGSYIQVKYQTIMNADTGKKRKTTAYCTVSDLINLEEFLDAKRAFIKELEVFTTNASHL